MIKCNECQQTLSANNVLSRHVRTSHNMTWVEYVIKHEYNGQQPTCVCGCGISLEWRKGGFPKYIKGHDNKGLQNSMFVIKTGDGWILNPFTGKEEYITLNDEVMLLTHCAKNNDAVTHDHGVKIDWVDLNGNGHILIPSFKHIHKNVYLLLDNKLDVNYQRRLLAVKSWCDKTQSVVLILNYEKLNFNVIDAYIGKKNDK